MNGPERSPHAARLAAACALVAAVALAAAPRPRAEGQAGELREAGIARAVQATPGTPDPRPNLVAQHGRWLVRGRWLPGGRQERTSWEGRCQEGAGALQLHVCVANTGSTASGPFSVAAEGAPAAALLTTSGLEPGEALCAPVDAAPGEALLVDPSGEVDERREDDNRLAPVPVPTVPPIAVPTCEPRPTPRAELSGQGWSGVVDVAGSGCLPPEQPPSARGRLLVANDGEFAAGPFRVGSPDWLVPDLPADAARTLEDERFEGAASLAIDADAVVPEHDETNNVLVLARATTAPTCTPEPSPTPGPDLPDLVPSFSLELPRCVDQGGVLHGRLAYRGCVANAGAVEATGFLVRFASGDAAEDEYVAQLDAGGLLCFAARADLPAEIVVDPDGRVAESDEANNRAQVLPPPQARPPLCTPGPPPTETPAPPPLPNLRGWARWWIDLPLGCIPPEGPIPPFQAELTVLNDGPVAAAAFDAVAATPSAQRWAFDGLPAGAAYTRGPGAFDFDRVTIDPDDRVEELDETDNEVFVPVPTLPPYCPTATATTGPTATPTGTATPVTPAPRSPLYAPYAATGSGSP